MKSLVHTEGLCSWSVPLEQNPGAKPLVCIGLYRQWINLLKNTVDLSTVFSMTMKRKSVEVLERAPQTSEVVTFGSHIL